MRTTKLEATGRRHRPADLAALSPTSSSSTGSTAPVRADFLNLAPPNNPGTSPSSPGPRDCSRVSSSPPPTLLLTVPGLALDFPLQSSSSNAPHSSPAQRGGSLLSVVGGGRGVGDLQWRGYRARHTMRQGQNAPVRRSCWGSSNSTSESVQPLLGTTSAPARSQLNRFSTLAAQTWALRSLEPPTSFTPTVEFVARLLTRVSVLFHLHHALHRLLFFRGPPSDKLGAPPTLPNSSPPPPSNAK